MRHDRARRPQWLVWSLAIAGGTVEPVLRVAAGDHFPSDCLIGAVVGASSGILFPALHRRRIPLRVISSAGREGAMVGVAGGF